jgi:hypothetical protein
MFKMKCIFNSVIALMVAFVLLYTICNPFATKGLKVISDEKMNSIYGGHEYFPCEACYYDGKGCEPGFYRPSICTNMFFVDTQGDYGDPGDQGCHPVTVLLGRDCARSSHCYREKRDCKPNPYGWECLFWDDNACSLGGRKYRVHECESVPEWGPDGTCECVLQDGWLDCEGTFTWCLTV